LNNKQLEFEFYDFIEKYKNYTKILLSIFNYFLRKITFQQFHTKNIKQNEQLCYNIIENKFDTKFNYFCVNNDSVLFLKQLFLIDKKKLHSFFAICPTFNFQTIINFIKF